MLHQHLSSPFFLNQIMAAASQIAPAERMALAQLVTQRKIRLVTRLGIGSFELAYQPTVAHRNVELNLGQYFGDVKSKVSPLAFIMTLCSILGIQVSHEQVIDRIATAGYNPNKTMKIITILRSILGVQLSTRKTDKVTKTVQQTVTGKGKKTRSRRRQHTTQGQENYLNPKVSYVRTQVMNWLENAKTGSLGYANVVGFTIYGVDAAVDTHDKAFGTRAHFALDVIVTGDKFTVVSVRMNEIISAPSPMVSKIVLHDFNTVFTNTLLTLITQGWAPTQVFGIDAEKMVRKTFTHGLNYAFDMWLERVVTVNAPANEQIAAAKSKIETILSSGKIDKVADKQLGEAASTVYDDSRSTVTPQELQLVGASAQASPFAASLPSHSWNPQQTYGNQGMPFANPQGFNGHSPYAG